MTNTTQNYDYAKSMTLDFSRVQRMLYLSGNNYYFTYSDRAYYSWAQGCTRYTIDGIEYYAILFMPRDSYHINNNMCALRIYRAGQWAPVRETVLDAGHGQAIAYNPDDGYLYISVYLRKNSEGKQYSSNEIMRIKEDDLSADSVSVKSFAHSLYGLKYMESESKLYGTDGNVIVTIDWENQTDSVYLTVPEEFALDSYRPHGNAWSMNSQYYVIGTWIPNQMIVISRDTNKIVWKYNIPEVLDRCNMIGEMESMYLDEDANLWMWTAAALQSPSYSQTDITQVFKTNLKTNQYYQTFPNEAFRNVPVQLYCKLDTNDPNPNGTKEHPFNHVQEAVNYLNYSPYGFGWIYMAANDYQIITLEWAGKTAVISGCDENFNQLQGQTYRQCGGLICRGGNVNVQNLDFNPYCEDLDQGCVEVTYGANAGIFNCEFSPENGYNAAGGLYVRVGNAYLSTVDDSTEWQKKHPGKSFIKLGNGGFCTFKKWYL
ncbi:MAG TPA: hypothetical protein IAD23_07725 [Candidatus Scubalenecus merdavium]|uniref:Uncharacterized protein n=1 Tax=Candidatus Scybalenecus merdavium TaxID=2840939 RepID=A0A9D1SNU0_9FIRM|nr:hypothetical protein [Candidatus Scubalenecus merdavium]